MSTKHSLFAIQIFTRLDESERLRARLHQILQSAGEHVSYAGKHVFYSELVNALLQSKVRFPYGHWDYTNDPEEAQTEFEEWSMGTIRDATDAARHSPDPEQERFMFLTFAVLIERKSDADRQLERACSVHADALWHRSTFEKLFLAFLRLDFRRVRSDVVFLCPGNIERGVTRADLTKEAYAYVKDVV